MASYKLKKEILASVSKDFDTIDKKVLDEVFTFIDSLDIIGGEFQLADLPIDKINELQIKLTEVINRSGYLNKIETFVRDLNKITLNSISNLEGNGYGFQRKPLNDIEKKWQSFTVQSLSDSGLHEGFTRPVLNVIDSAISMGKSVTELRGELKDYIVGGKDQTGRLKSYVTTTAREAVSTMQGAQINGVANELGYDYLQYTGGLLDDSRGQCYHWVHEMNGKIPKDKIEFEIKEAYKNQRAKKIIFDGEDKHRYSGMKPNTTIKNFIIVRGGWGCIHSIFPRKNRKK